MNYYQFFLAIIRQKIGIMVLAGLLLAALAFWGVMFFSAKYQSNFDVLVVQNYRDFVDSYTLAKSTEHFSKLLSESVYTEAFLNKVVENYPDLGKALPLDREKRMEKWGKMVKTSLNVELGMIHIKVLANDRIQAESVSRAVASVLANNNKLFTSENQSIEVRMVNAPVVKNNPGTAALALLILVSFLVGAFLIFAAGFYSFVIRNQNQKSEIRDERAPFENFLEGNLTRDSEGNLIDAETGKIVN